MVLVSQLLMWKRHPWTNHERISLAILHIRRQAGEEINIRSGRADPVQVKGLKQGPLACKNERFARSFLLSGIELSSEKIASLSYKSPSSKSLLNWTRSVFSLLQFVSKTVNKAVPFQEARQELFCSEGPIHHRTHSKTSTKQRCGRGRDSEPPPR